MLGSPGKEVVQETANPYITKEPTEGGNAEGSGLGQAQGLGPGPAPGNDFKTPRKIPQFTYVPKQVEGEGPGGGESKDMEQQEGEAMLDGSVGMKGPGGSVVNESIRGSVKGSVKGSVRGGGGGGTVKSGKSGLVNAKGSGLAVPLTVGSSVVGSSYPLSLNGGGEGSYTDSKNPLPLSPVGGGGSIAGGPGLGGLGLGFLTPPRVAVPAGVDDKVASPGDETFLNQV